MSEVTREDVIRLLGESEVFEGLGTVKRTEEAADALIAAFPHLVGSVEITSAEGGYSAPDGPNGDRPEHWTPRVRTVYTVTGPWFPVPTDGDAT